MEAKRLAQDHIQFATGIAGGVTGGTGTLEREDCLQAGCVGLCRASQRYNGKGDFKSYAYSRIRGEVLDRLRSEYAIKRAEERAMLLAPISSSLSVESLRMMEQTPEDEAERRRASKKVQQLILRLSAREGYIVLAHYYFDQSLTDIARDLKLSKSYVTRLRQRALQRLRKWLSSD